MEEHALGVARDAGELTKGVAVLRQPRPGRIRTRHDAAGAHVRMAAQALRAASAEAGETGDDVIAGPHGRHLGADRLHDAGAFVAQHERAIERVPADTVDDVEIAVAHAGRDGADEHLAAPRCVEVHVLDRQRLVHLAKDRGFHRHVSS